ncbi:hypothetical protein ABVC71_07155 [Prevotella amnii]|uniref:hypothetical protein n=1 Tax=Prevotella amnii TaxID=419005 RepID=UPI00336AB635
MRKKEEKKLPYCKPMAYLMTMPGYMPLMAGSIQGDITGTIDGGDISGEGTSEEDFIGQEIPDGD